MEDTVGPALPAPVTDPTSAIRVFLLAEVRDYTRFSQERGDEETTRLVARFAHVTRHTVDT
ncbi:MAG: hypothetical protein NVS4B2_32040 [Chloroflexota bacterium]